MWRGGVVVVVVVDRHCGRHFCFPGMGSLALGELSPGRSRPLMWPDGPMPAPRPMESLEKSPPTLPFPGELSPPQPPWYPQGEGQMAF